MIRTDRSHRAKDPVRARQRERGIALIIVLWIIVAIALLVSTFNASVRSGLSFVRSEVELFETQAVLDAGLEIAAARLLDSDEARRWQADGRVYEVPVLGRELHIRIFDANGRVDLNKTSGDVLVRLFENVLKSRALAQRLCKAVLLARKTSQSESCAGAAKKTEREDRSDDQAKADQTPTPSSSPQETLADRQTDRSRPDRVPELAFIDVTQLRDLPGFDPEHYKRLSPYLTVYSREGRINPFTASDTVLEALPRLTGIELERFRRLRRDAPGDQKRANEILEPAASYLSREAGPAYLIEVATSRSMNRELYGRQFVIIVGFDEAAPYRLVASRFF